MMRVIFLRMAYCAVPLLLLGLASPAVAQPRAALTPLQAAFAAGDAEALLADAADRVEITLLGEGQLYSRAQAMYVMKAFFRDYEPARFVLLTENQAEGNWLVEGTYAHQRPEPPLEVFLRLRLKERRWQLREIRIERPLR